MRVLTPEQWGEVHRLVTKINRKDAEDGVAKTISILKVIAGEHDKLPPIAQPESAPTSNGVDNGVPAHNGHAVQVAPAG